MHDCRICNWGACHDCKLKVFVKPRYSCGTRVDAGDLIKSIASSSGSGTSTPFVDHYGVASEDREYVIHLMPGGVRKDRLDTDEWKYAGKCGGAEAAKRAENSRTKRNYNLIRANCEHFARKLVGDGNRSKQVSGFYTGAVLGGAFGVIFGPAGVLPCGIIGALAGRKLNQEL